MSDLPIESPAWKEFREELNRRVSAAKRSGASTVRIDDIPIPKTTQELANEKAPQHVWVVASREGYLTEHKPAAAKDTAEILASSHANGFFAPVRYRKDPE